jgi:hypothetical protein
MRQFFSPLVISGFVLPASLLLLFSAAPLETSAAQRYFAHEAVEDSHGVIAPWYRGQNGQLDYRARIAAETLKRYPWTVSPKTSFASPDYIMSGQWNIASDGTITTQEQNDWQNGDLGQRTAFSLFAWVNYYRYSGDPAAIAHISMIADLLLEHTQTDDNHPWPRFLISVPTRGVPYGKADPHGMIQLDIVAQVGLGLAQAYQMIGETRWLDAAKHWADLLAEKRNPDSKSGFPPWNRYANPEDVVWSDLQTGGVSMLLEFFDELIRLGYTGRNNSIVEARDAGRAYLRDKLLPRWTEAESFAHHYWDWVHTTQCEVSTEVVARYVMDHPAEFPNWRNDARNLLTMYIHRACVSTKSRGDVFSGAWAYPEGADCCGRSLCYGPLQIGYPLAKFGVTADSEWAREMARRQFLLATHDFHETGVVEDNIDGGKIVAGGWFKIVGPFALKFALEAVGWLPESFGANRENHIVRSTAIVQHPVYGDGKITYSTYDAPKNTVDVLRLAYRPTRITADGKNLKEKSALNANGFQVKALANGDCIVTIRHDRARDIMVEGDDPQEYLAESAMQFSENWNTQKPSSRRRKEAESRDPQQVRLLTSAATGYDAATLHTTSEADATMTCTFNGNQVRLIGAVGNDGGQADIFVDGVKQLCGVDFWNPKRLQQQTVWYKNGLASGEHTLKVVATGKKNPRSTGAKITIESVQFSAATGDAGFGEGGGPTDSQRWIFGYPQRDDYMDSQGYSWRPATEVVIRMDDTNNVPAVRRLGDVIDSWYSIPRRLAVTGTSDPVLYGYGMHGRDFTAYATVGPGKYHVRLKFMETRNLAPQTRAMDISINGKPVVSRLDIAATATGIPGQHRPLVKHEVVAGLNQAVDLVFDNIEPRNGVIAVRFTSVGAAEVIVSAMEIGPGPGGQGRKPVSAPKPPTAAPTPAATKPGK